MPTAAKFQRARKPEEKEIRRRAVLTAARKLMREVGSIDFSLSELARRSGVSKPNIYRYFESREEVLLQVWVEEVGELEAAYAKQLVGVRRGDIEGTARALTTVFVERPLFCELTSVSAALERNLSAEAILSAKKTLEELVLRIGDLLHRQLPQISTPDCLWAAGTLATYLCGLWPASRPHAATPVMRAHPEIAAMQPDLARDLERTTVVLFQGLQH